MDIFKAESLGVSFSLNVQTPTGASTIPLDSRQLTKLELDPENFKASLFGLSVNEYYQWLENDGAVICSEIMSKGRRCKNAVAGGSQLDSNIWKERQGGYCVTHGGTRKL